jgi:hypothetical protein
VTDVFEVLEHEDGLGERGGALGAAAQLAQQLPSLKRGDGAFARTDAALPPAVPMSFPPPDDDR